jgi:hypothetical protein
VAGTGEQKIQLYLFQSLIFMVPVDRFVMAICNALQTVDPEGIQPAEVVRLNSAQGLYLVVFFASAKKDGGSDTM